MPPDPAPTPLPYASLPRPHPLRRLATHVATRRLLAALALLLTLWIASYLYFRTAHSFGGTYASAPIAWKQINYDEHHPWTTPLFHLHQPLARLDQHLTGTEIRTHKNNFHGRPENYPREEFN